MPYRVYARNIALGPWLLLFAACFTDPEPISNEETGSTTSNADASPMTTSISAGESGSEGKPTTTLDQSGTGEATSLGTGTTLTSEATTEAGSTSFVTLTTLTGISTTSTQSVSTESSTGGFPDAEGTCADPTVVIAGAPAIGDTTNRIDARSSSACGSDGPEQVFSFEAEMTGVATARVSLGPDVVVYARRECLDDDAYDLACVDEEVTSAEHLRFPVEAGELYFIIVDSFEATDVGAFQIEVAYVNPEASCSNGVDDNGDLLVDCEDPTCEGSLPCGGSLAEACEDVPVDLTPGVPVQGSTVDGVEGFSPDLDCGYYYSLDGRSDAYRYTPRVAQAMRVELAGASVQTWHVRSDCADELSQVWCFPVSYQYDGSVGFVELPQGPEYSLFVTAAAAGFEGSYTLDTDVADLEELEPNDATAEATPTDGSSIGFISGATDLDVWSFELQADAGVTVTVGSPFVVSDCETGHLDPVLEVLDAAGNSIGVNDDTTANYCSQLQLATLAAGTYYAVVRPYSSCYWCSFPYRIGITF